jgi:very-short-patch-repair endonuclease
MKAKRQYRGGYNVAGLATLARDLRRQQTSAEELLWQLLRDRKLLGVKFRRQHQFGDYIADFFCREANVVIECDGEVHNRNDARQHDRNRDAYMISQGLRIVRISNHRILNETESVLFEIQNHLSASSGSGVEGDEFATGRRPSPPPSPRGRGR